jgi:ubiquinone/menaquinone biosynthesis C-methylase UbiE
MADHNPEPQAIAERYARRSVLAETDLYDPLDPYVLMAHQEWERALVRCIRLSGLAPLGNRRLLEVGCGTGGKLLDLIRLGFQPRNLVGNDLLKERLSQARSRLPADVTLVHGDASTLTLEDESFDIVFQSTVFSSILDITLRERLSERMWRLSRPGGGILWYDFIWDNPANPDVSGVSVRKIRRLFPKGVLRVWPITLAPPIGRRLCRVFPALYQVVNALTPLRTHVMCWVAKPR